MTARPQVRTVDGMRVEPIRIPEPGHPIMCWRYYLGLHRVALLVRVRTDGRLAFSDQSTHRWQAHLYEPGEMGVLLGRYSRRKTAETALIAAVRERYPQGDPA